MKINNKSSFTVFFVGIVLSLAMSVSYAATPNKLKLPALFSDNMMLQRDQTVPVWGWGEPGAKVAVSIAGQQASATANNQGRWQVNLSPMKFGGPFKMKIKSGTTSLQINHVLIGEVWLCSGQSNMKFPLSHCLDGKKTAQNASNSQIRLFSVPLKSAGSPQQEMAKTRRKDYRRWLECTPENSIKFSGLGIFYALELYKKLKMPVGIIDCSYGGTRAEAWTESAQLNTPILKPILQRYEEELKKFPALRKTYDSHMAAYRKLGKLKRKKAKAFKDSETRNDPAGYSKTGFKDNAWPKFILRQTPRREIRWTGESVIWLRFTSIIPEDWKNKKLTLTKFSIPGNADLFCNGAKIAEYTGNEYHPVKVTIPAKILTSSKVVITLRSHINTKCGALLGVPRLICPGKKANIFLKGNWRWHAEKVADGVKAGVYPYVFPPTGPGHKDAVGGLYNGMVYPVAPYAVRGVLWYQGEGNHARGRQYRELLPTMIKCWRHLWNSKNFPFVIVQLPNYGSAAIKPPKRSAWAELREAQQMTAANDPNASLVATIDIGDANNMHPENKKDVAGRAVSTVWKNVYHKTKSGDSPVYDSVKISGNKIIIKIKNDDGGLIFKGKKIEGFTIAGKDQIFHWAKAKMLSDGQIEVSCQSVTTPVAVRYAWANNPRCNLYNSKGLPMVPFRSDNWLK
jgi:sialate O-acetylesterase